MASASKTTSAHRRGDVRPRPEGRLERTLRTFSTLAGIPSLLILIVFMLLGGPILGLVYSKPIYHSDTAVLVLLILSAAKLTAV